MATKIVFASRLPSAIIDTARAMVPPGFEMTAVDHGTPAFYEALHDAEFYLGFPRPGMGNEFFRAAPRLRLVQLVTDRKSTRLNSSHGYISYAVFCLKKKKELTI